MYCDDKDFEQKAKMQKIFWTMGMWTRIDIPIVVYEDDRQNDKLKKLQIFNGAQLKYKNIILQI